MTRIGLLAGILLAFAAEVAEAAPVKIVASFSVLKDIAQQIAGDHADVTSLVPPDGDAHSFDPSPADAEKLGSASLVLVNGLGLDRWMEQLATSAGYKGPLVVASAGIAAREMPSEGDGKVVTDPHAWQDLRNGAIYVGNIERALEAVDPGNAADYRSRAAAYSAVLVALDAEVRAAIGSVPAAKRRVITSHDAFGYFGAAYGVTFLAPEGISTDAEPSAGAVAKLVDQIKAEHIKAVFIENMTDARLIATIARETGAELGGTLYSDALSKPGGEADNYVGMFKNNVPKLVAGMLKN